MMMMKMESDDRYDEAVAFIRTRVPTCTQRAVVAFFATFLPLAPLSSTCQLLYIYISIQQ